MKWISNNKISKYRIIAWILVCLAYKEKALKLCVDLQFQYFRQMSNKINTWNAFTNHRSEIQFSFVNCQLLNCTHNSPLNTHFDCLLSTQLQTQINYWSDWHWFRRREEEKKLNFKNFVMCKVIVGKHLKCNRIKPH